MKSALCISGHLRTFQHTYKSIKKHIIDPLNCDVFVHTWDVIGAPTAKNPGDIDNQQRKTIDFLSEIYSTFNPKLMSIEEEADKLPEFIQRTQDITVPASEQQFVMKHIGLHVSMFYSIFTSNTLRIEYEQEQNIEYDLIVRIRPDLFFNTSMSPQMFRETDRLYLPEIATYTSAGVNDQVAIGTSNIMNTYCDLYKNIVNYYRNHECTARPEVMVKYYLDKMKIKTNFIPISYDIYRLDGSILKQHKMHAEWKPGNFLK